jgi:hypothetical protein
MFSVMTEGRPGSSGETVRRPLERLGQALSGARRGLAAGIASLLAALVLTSSAAGEHSALELVSTGPAGGNGAFHAVLWEASEDGSRVYFQTDESLVSADTDNAIDIYERAAGETTLVSIGPDGGNGEFPASFEGASPDGARTSYRPTSRW